MSPRRVSGSGAVAVADPAIRPRSAIVAHARSIHVTPLLLFVACTLVLFRFSLVADWTFVGDSDRLNTALNIRLLETDAIRARGSAPTWSDDQFMGYSVVGAHWLLPAFTPVPYLLARLPSSAMYDALAVLAAGLLALTIGLAYWSLGAYCTDRVPRVVGALLYGLGSYVIHKLTQLDVAFIALAAAPFFLRVIRETRRENAAGVFLILAAAWAGLVLFTVLQEIAYVALFFGTYALYRSIRTRDPWPVAVAWLALACGVAVGMPRVLTIATELPLVARTSNNIETAAHEALRYFGDGLLGRYPREQRLVRGQAVNLHEGIQLLHSGLAALAVIAAGLLARSWVVRLWGVGLVVVLSVALGSWWEPFYDAIRRVPYTNVISRELLIVLVNAVVIGVPLWLAGRWLAGRAIPPAAASPSSSPPVRAASRHGPGLVLRHVAGDASALTAGPPLARARRAGGEGNAGGRAAPRRGGTSRDGLTAAAREDVPYFFGFVVLGLAAILIPEVRTILYYAFMRIDFMHSRLSVAMTLPLAVLATVFLARYLPSTVGRRAQSSLIAGLLLGLLLWLMREAIGQLLVADGVAGEVLNVFRPRRLLTIEAFRVATSLLLLVVAATLLVRRSRPELLTLVGGVLAGWMAFETVIAADFKLNGDQVRYQSVPLNDLNYMQAPPGAFTIPTSAQRAAVRARLEADAYRVVLQQDNDRFAAHVEPHLAAFWGLRLVEGYSTGVPRRIAALPWAKSMYSSHFLDIDASHTIPWRLLAALNVKYVVTVDRAFWYNPAPGGERKPLDVSRLDVQESPYPVTPRAFFAEHVAPAGDVPRFPGDDGARPPPDDPFVADPVGVSLAEGFLAERDFPTDGTLTPTFDRDQITVRVDPSASDRFLVVNELYHPAWIATVDGRPATIYPTNLVMRGVLVPAGATVIELRHAPFITTPAGLGLLAGALVLTAGIWLGLVRYRHRLPARISWPARRRAMATGTR